MISKKYQAALLLGLRLAMAGVPQEAQATIIEIMDTYSDKLVLGWDKIKTFCLSSTPKLAWHQRIAPHVVGMCVANRSGTLGDVTRAHELGAKIQAQGFVESKTEGATCFVAPSDPALLEQTIRENSKASPTYNHVGSAVAELRDQSRFDPAEAVAPRAMGRAPSTREHEMMMLDELQLLYV
jgi:hypothetical protein